MSTAPLATPVTRPAATVATDGLDDCQVASFVTFWAVPSAIVAVAVNDDVAPMIGAAPLTARPVTLGDDADDGCVGDDELVQAADSAARPTRTPRDFGSVMMKKVSGRSC
jgi:hypothetical protein